MMLTTLMIALLIGQRQLPTADPSTWDGVAGSDVIRTDETTGEITYPMGQQPADALTLGCVFGRSNVRCPKPIDRTALETAAEEAERARAAGRIRFDTRLSAETPAALVTRPMAEQLAAALPDDVIFPSDMLSGSGTAPGNGANEKYAEAEPEAEPQSRPGCHREEYRYPDGSGGGVRFVCSSGDQRLLDSVTDALEPASD